MKKLVFELKKAFYDKSIQENIIGRKDILLVVLEACRYMMHNEQVPNATNKLILVVNEMNRLFFCSDEKMFSVMFPFHVNEYPLVRFDLDNIPIDSKVLSTLIQYIESKEFSSDDALDFITPIGDIQEQSNADFWKIVRHLLLYDIGYVRYDDDPEGFKKASKAGRPKQHPRYHYDVNLDSQATFKLGMSKKITSDKFIDMLDNKKDRFVLKEP